jgi:hypothetical protein
MGLFYISFPVRVLCSLKGKPKASPSFVSDLFARKGGW